MESKSTSDAEYEGQLHEAINSAEQWKAFASKLEEELKGLEAKVKTVSDNLEVKSAPCKAHDPEQPAQGRRRTYR